MNSSQALRQSPIIARIPAAPLLLQRVQGRGSSRFGAIGGVDRFQVTGELDPVLAGGVAEGVADQVDDAGLHDGQREGGVGAVGEPLQALHHSALLGGEEDGQDIADAILKVRDRASELSSM